MGAIETVRNLMHGERRLCSASQIERETGLNAEIVKPLMVEIAMEPVPRDRYKRRSFTDEEVETIARMWNGEFAMIDIANEIHRDYNSVRHKIWTMVRDGILPNRKGDE